MHAAELIQRACMSSMHESILVNVAERPLKLEEIAKLAGVSKATVSSVLNGKAEKYRIKTETQNRIRAIAKQHGYQPNYSAAALRRGRSHSIGFIVPDFENRSYLRIAKRLEALARAAGYQLIIASSDDDKDTEVQTAKLLVARSVDALLVSSCLNHDASVYETIMQQGTPVIALDRALPGEFSSVISDDFQGAFELTNSLDFTRVTDAVLVGAIPELDVSLLREKGFLEALKGHPGTNPHCFYGEHFDAESGKLTVQEAIKNLGKLPEVILTTSFSLLEGIIEFLQGYEDKEAGNANVISSDSKLQLATFGNSRLLDFLPLPVNSLPQQYEKIAESAWKIAQESIEKEYQTSKVTINRTLTIRM